ncbi:MAG: dihydropteroate synthase, partial [Deltaproteobacteria bacterium]|nr:dihydropteroate synthase [Deltaproteobacteria bacterium]
NCSIGPDLMLPTVKKISRYSKLPISIIPNAGLPQSEDGKTVFKLTPEEMAAHIETYISEYGVNIVGGCCGTSPAHISKVAEVAKGRKPLKRNIETGVFVSGPQNAIRLDSSESLIRIGERLNVRGSKKVRDAVEGQSPIDQDALEEVLKEQVKDLGLELVDVCMDSNLVNTADTMVEVIKAQTVDFPGAMVLDSFDVKALEKGIQAYPGRAIINSISLEEVEPGLDKIDAVARVTKEHAPVYIALTTDEKGPAVTAEQKFNLAQRIVDKAQREHGIKPEQIMIDINAFPIGAESVEGMNFAVESIKSIAKIKGIHPDLKTTIGVGNLTNGLANKPYMRKVLTSVFLDEARKEGLDAAIVNPNHYVPVDSLSKEDYQIGLKIVLEHDMDAFSRLEEIAEMKKGVAVKKKVQYIDLDPVESVCQKIKDGFKERETGSVMMDGMEFGYSDKIVTQVSEIIKGGMKPLDLINQHLMKAMQELGDGFAAGDVSLPHLLKSADVMKQVMGFLEDYMKRGTNEKDTSPKKKGVVVLGTVYQDVHSIGKDLAKTLLENYGFTVIDLGVQVPLQSFIDSAKEHQADIVGMSALLVQTSNHMITLSSMMTEQGFEDTPILIGGAPVNHRHAAYVAMAGIQDENQMKENVFYCNSAMDGVNIINSLMDKEKKSELCKANKKKLLTAFQAGKKRQVQTDELLKTLPRRKVDFSISPTFEGAFPPVQTLSFSMSEFYPHLDQKMLFSLNWRYGGKKSQEKRGVSNQELRDKLLNWINKIDERRWITPLAAYGLFYCKGNGNKVTVFHPETKKEIGCFEFNDVIGEGKKDIFNAAEFYNSDRLDVIGIQISTAGINSEKAIGAFKDEKDQESAWDLQGLSDRVAEDMANLANQRLESLFFGEKKAKSARYSPGYPAMSDISNNQLIFDLLNAKELLQMQITKGFEFVPTSSTGAVVCFHPFAGYR